MKKLIKVFVLTSIIASCSSGESGTLANPGRIPDAALGTPDDQGGGESTQDAGASDTVDASLPALPPTDFSAQGPASVVSSGGRINVPGCGLDYELYTPQGALVPAIAPLVVLGHGFSRSADKLSDLASHIASFGMRVALPEFCHSSFFDTDHQQNGVDAAALAADLAEGAPYLYAGHSAGGLSAVVAASLDPGASGVLGLDLTDADDLAVGIAPSLSPLSMLGILGDASSCNAQGNGAAVFNASPSASTIKVAGASHCDFEAPTSFTCTSLCSGSDDAKRAVIMTLSAAYAALTLGVDATGEAWISETGSEHLRLRREGLITDAP